MSPESRRGHSQHLLPSVVGATPGRYLLAIHWLAEDGDRISTTELRRAFGVAGASVTEMVDKLDERGLVDYEKYEGVRLTDGVPRRRPTSPDGFAS